MQDLLLNTAAANSVKSFKQKQKNKDKQKNKRWKNYLHRYSHHQLTYLTILFDYPFTVEVKEDEKIELKIYRQTKL